MLYICSGAREEPMESIAAAILSRDQDTGHMPSPARREEDRGPDARTSNKAKIRKAFMGAKIRNVVLKTRRAGVAEQNCGDDGG